MSFTKGQCENVWKRVDKAGVGQLTIAHLKTSLKTSQSITDKEMALMFATLDENGDDKTISKQEFMNEMADNQKRCAALKQLIKNRDGNNILSPGQVKKLIEDTKLYTSAIVNHVVDVFCKQCDSGISVNDFKKLLR